jgi:hypothetical protein
LLYQHRTRTQIGCFRWLICCIERESVTALRLVASKSEQSKSVPVSVSLHARPANSRPGPTSTVCGGKCHVGLPPRAPAAWPTTGNGDGRQRVQANVPPHPSTAGPCRHTARRQAPRVGWGHCRHTRHVPFLSICFTGGPFCQ